MALSPAYTQQRPVSSPTQKIDASIVIPAFNEADRLPLFLDRVIAFCIGSERNYEVIVVDDGSRDDTSRIVESYKTVFPNFRAIRLEENKGKGYAVKKGLLMGHGEIGLFMDADGSVQPDEIEKNMYYLTEKGYDIFVGSRVLTSHDQVLKVKWYRKTIGTVFNFLVRTLLFKEIKDTQCGFKMFKRETILPLFEKCRLRDFSFDFEILFLAHKMGLKIKEGPVSWTNVKGSKVNLLSDPIKMFINLLRIKKWHAHSPALSLPIKKNRNA